MAIQIVPREASLGENFGKSLATGLGGQLASLGGQAIGAGAGAIGAGLSKLGQKIGITEEPKKLTKEMLVKAGFSEADADIILAMPPEFQYKMMESISQRAPAEAQEKPKQVEPEKGLAPEGQVSEEFKKQYEAIKGVPFDSTIEKKETTPEQEMVVTEQGVVPSQIAPGEEPKLAEQTMIQPSVAKPVETRPSALFGKTKQQVEKEARIGREEETLNLKKAGHNLAEKKFEHAKEEAEKNRAANMTKEERKEQHVIDRETKPYYDKVVNESKGAQKTDVRLNRMEELVKKGNIRHPAWNSLFDTVAKGIWGIGFDLHFLQNADTTEFRKLSREFIKGAKEIFGSKVTEGEIKLLLEAIPSLSQTDEGKMRIINNLRIFNEGAKAEKDAMEEIIEENGGNRPKNLELEVSKRSKKKLDSLAEELKSGIQKNK